MLKLVNKYNEWLVNDYPFLEGRLLLWNEVLGFLKSCDYMENEIKSLLRLAYLEGKIEIKSAVSMRGKQLLCERCGSSEQLVIEECASCNNYCATCEACISYGRATSCTPLFYFKKLSDLTSDIAGERGGRKGDQDDSLIWIQQSHILYSPAQARVASSIEQFMSSDKFQQFLLWAVTGAGKTELCYPAISYALERGQRVLFTAPRKDVVKELAVRFKRDFPSVPISALYANSPDRNQAAKFYLATTQQTLRFYNYFDLVIIDELDAFPYHNNPQLQGYVGRAMVEGAKQILMTATPPRDWQKRLGKSASLMYEILPLRYHQQPLPLPRVIITNNYRPVIEKFLLELQKCEGKGLIFVPRVRAVRKWTEQINNWLAEKHFAESKKYFRKIKGIHAGDSEHSKQVDKFRQGELTCLVTTTILERGVTFANLHVLVLDAGDNIYDEATLVQIAGRVGRNPDYPTGIVWFVSSSRTKALKHSIKQIRRMNQRACSKNFSGL